jgi:type IV pilus assembly protein PilQ
MYLFCLSLKFPPCLRLKTGSGDGTARFVSMCVAMLFFFCYSATAHSAGEENNVISGVQGIYDDGLLQVKLRGSTVPIYTAYELFKPARIVIDVAGSQLASGVTLAMPADSGIAMSSKTINDAKPLLTRFVFTLDKSKPFSVLVRDTDILVSIGVAGTGKPVQLASGQKDKVSSPAISGRGIIASQLPEINPLQPTGQAGGIDGVGSRQDAFGFEGFNKERITVDFYKIDLHNVFRLLREVSGQNIVVDESVSGSLTLALNDVPWDFALDIILNLKGLQKEERFNTIVILPGNKEFFWPERVSDTLDFEADLEVVAQEALLIQQQESVPPAVVEARGLVEKGRKLESRGKFEQAVMLYEEALQKWPDNARLAGRISSIYLVQLRQNAKALFFARKALAVDSKSNRGLLNAAIASFNMEDIVVAGQYFDKAVMGSKPSKEALLNYAVFSEEQRSYRQALKLLRKHNLLHGEDLNSMLALARILDKQGKEDEAVIAYRRILLSGFRITPDLREFVQERTSLGHQPM